MSPPNVAIPADAEPHLQLSFRRMDRCYRQPLKVARKSSWRLLSLLDLNSSVCMIWNKLEEISPTERNGGRTLNCRQFELHRLQPAVKNSCVYPICHMASICAIRFGNTTKLRILMLGFVCRYGHGAGVIAASNVLWHPIGNRLSP